jgi:formylglycine-generating enzyme required for sulfatase activity
LGDSAVPEDKKKQIIVVIILVIIAVLIFLILYNPSSKKQPYFAGKRTSVAAKVTAGSLTKSGSAVIQSSDTQDISIFDDEYAQQEQLNFENGQGASQQELSTAEQRLSQTGSIFSSGQSVSQQGQSALRQGQSTSQQGQSALRQGQSASQQGQSTSQQGESALQHEQSPLQQDQLVSLEGQSPLQQGESASQHEQSSLQQDQLVSLEGQSPLQQDESALQQGQTVLQHGELASQQGLYTTERLALMQEQSNYAAGQTQQANFILSQRGYQEARRTTPVRPAPVQRVISANMRFLSSGSFEMETVLDEQDTEENIDTKNVTVNSFYISKYEVTQREYENIMKKNPSYFKGPNLPVENVSWYDAIEYCNALSRREGLTLAYTITGTGNDRVVTWNRNANGYRLPTEEEWVYACRANTTTPFNTGNSINRNMSNYFGKRTVNIGSYQPNAWGLYDMHGNVSEWCWNLFNTSDSSSETRIIRGGSWLNTSMRLRTSFRDHYFPNMRTMSIGFRVAQNY